MENYSPKSWVSGEIVYATDMNHLEQGIAALYPQETIIAPEQTVTITAEDTDGVAIALADGYTLPETLPDNWTVVVNGNTLPYVHRELGDIYDYTDTTQTPTAVWQVDLYEGQLWLYVAQPAQTIRPGDYTVKITEAAETFPPAITSADNGKVLGVVDGKWALVSPT